MRYRYLFMFFLCCLLPLGGYGQNAANISEDIVKAVKQGDAKALSAFFNPKIELVILDRENVYNKTQATMIMKSFFEENKPNSFRIIHQGGKVDANFAIGLYTSGNKVFRIYLLIKTVEKNPLIHQLRIEKENGHS